MPYFNDGSPVHWSGTSSYDLLDRPLSTYTPDDEHGTQTVTYGYNAFTATATDPKGRVSETVKNSQGWTLSNIRNRDAGTGALDYSAVTYTYDALGNLKSTTAAGVATTLAYDLRGRKLTMTDADMGPWLYRYNIFGELIWQKDAKGQITTLVYDDLGRLTSRTEAEGATTWTYDTSPTKGIGKLHTVAAPGGYAEAYTYDAYGRPAQVQRTIDGATYYFDSTYDTYGRAVKTEYPTVNGGRFATRNVYNDFGFLKEIRHYLAADDVRPNSQLQGKVYWMADSYHVFGRVDGETYGNGLANDRVYSAATGRLRMASIDRGSVTAAPYAIQQMIYTYDVMGNVETRSDNAVGRGESFEYDGLDRLLTHTVVTGAGGTVSVVYDQKGNITSKSDVGAYAYNYTPAGRSSALPHAVSAAGASSYTYDANGNMLSGGGRTITWTSFNQAASIVKGGFTSTFSFGAGHERVKHVSHHETTIYVGGLFEKVTPVGGGAITEYKHYIVAPSGRVAVYTDRSNFVQDVKYFHTDGLGSITAVSDEKGAIVKRFAFDAWGKRINPTTGATITGTDAAGLRRGYTDHEQLDDLGLVHMNGRVYDPVLGRFLSADPTVDGVEDAQGFNRYSYVGNNPMNATDPSGYFKLKDVLKIAAVIVVSVVGFGIGYGATYALLATNTALTAGQIAAISTLAGGFTAGFASGFSGSLLNGASIGDAFRSGLTNGAVGAATAGLLSKVGAARLNWFKRGIAHGLIQGGASEATGGEFRHGFYAGFAVGASEGGIATLVGDSDSMGIAAAAIVGGTASELGGGKFANGAVSGAFSYLFNQLSGPRAQRGLREAIVYDKNDRSAREFALVAEATRKAGRNSEVFAVSDWKELGESVISAAKARGQFDRILVVDHGDSPGLGVLGAVHQELARNPTIALNMANALTSRGTIWMFVCGAGASSAADALAYWTKHTVLASKLQPAYTVYFEKGNPRAVAGEDLFYEQDLRIFSPHNFPK